MATPTDLRRPSEVLDAHREEILQILRDSGATNARVFGSSARGEDAVGSDIDLLVSVDPARAWDFVSLPRELSEILGVPVDVVSDRGLKSKHEAVLREARAL